MGNVQEQKLEGKFKQVLRELDVECTAQTMPEVAVAHVAHLEAGNVLKIKHLELPQGAHATSDAEAVVASCLFPAKSLKTPQTSEPKQQSQTMNNRDSLLREQL